MHSSLKGVQGTGRNPDVGLLEKLRPDILSTSNSSQKMSFLTTDDKRKEKWPCG